MRQHMGILRFAGGRGLIFFMSYYFAADLIKLLPLDISEGSLLKTIGLADLTGFFNFWHLSFKYEDLARIFFLVFGLSFLRLPQLVRTLRGSWAKAGMVRPEELYLGWKKFAQDESAEVVKDRLDRLIEDWKKNVPAYTPAELEIIQETVEEKLTEYAKQLEKEPGITNFIKYRLGAIGLALFFLLTQALAIPAYILAYPAIRLRSWESGNPYLDIWLKLGQQFMLGCFHIWILAAEIGIIVMAGLLLGEIPQLGFAGKFASGIILSLEGEDGAISWGEKLFGEMPEDDAEPLPEQAGKAKTDPYCRRGSNTQEEKSISEDNDPEDLPCTYGEPVKNVFAEGKYFNWKVRLSDGWLSVDGIHSREELESALKRMTLPAEQAEGWLLLHELRKLAFQQWEEEPGNDKKSKQYLFLRREQTMRMQGLVRTPAMAAQLGLQDAWEQEIFIKHGVLAEGDNPEKVKLTAAMLASMPEIFTREMK